MKVLVAGILLFGAFSSTHLHAADQTIVAHQAADKLRKAVELTSDEDVAVLHLADEFIRLPMDQVFNQGRTNWCWAYSAFHTMRSYYLYAADESEAVVEWQNAIQEINSPNRFASYMSARRHPGQTGHPIWFVNHLRHRGGEAPLPMQSWQGIWARGARTKAADHPYQVFPTDKADSQKTRSELVTYLQKNLEQSVPSTWCGVGHCVTIYGAALRDGKAISYMVADSAGSRPTYTSDAARMNARLELLFTLDL